MIKKPVKFCPICGGKLEADKKLGVMTCVNCDYKFWRNAKPTVSGIIIKNDKVLLAKRSTKKFFGWWDGPGGFLENGEDPIVGLKREIMEEIGVRVTVKEFINTSKEDDPDNPIEDGCVLALQFLCELESGEPQALHETSEVKWFAKDEIPWDKIAFDGIRSALEIVYGIRKPYLPD